MTPTQLAEGVVLLSFFLGMFAGAAITGTINILRKALKG